MPMYDVDTLGVHPRQDEIFGDCTEAELAGLVRSLQKHGLKHPIEILPDRTVVAGHQRLRAARRLGWKKIAVKVRSDLAAAGAAAVEAHLIADNLDRRHLTTLAKARCVTRLIELEQGRADGPRAVEAMKDKVGERLGLSRRSVSRYVLLAAAPKPLQDACDAGHVSLSVACRAACLPRAALAGLVKAMLKADGRPAADKVREALGDRGPDSGHHAYVRLLGAIRRELPKIASRPGDISPGRLTKSRAEVRDAIRVLQYVVK